MGAAAAAQAGGRVPVPEPWPALDWGSISGTAEHLHRIVQIAGKYTLDRPFELNWGSIPLRVTARGVTTPVLQAGVVMFTVDINLLDDCVTVTSSAGRASVPLGPGSVAQHYAAFVAAAANLGIPAPGSTRIVEIPGAGTFETDTEIRPYEPEVARTLWRVWADASAALQEWQASYAGPRPPVGVMWGGFDLAATRYNGRPLPRRPAAPMFLQNGQTTEVVAVGFTFGSTDSPVPAFYAYISPPPPGMAGADFGVSAAGWVEQAGLAVLPWAAARAQPDPQASVVRFADAVYALAVEQGGWPAELLGARPDGWYASRRPVPAAEEGRW